MLPIEIAQRILNGPWQYAAAAVEACQRGEWPEFVRMSAPARPLLFGRLDYGRCLKMAERSLTGPETIKLTLVPLWACSTAEESANEWVAVHGVAWPGQRLVVREAGPFIAIGDASPRADALWECTVRRWTAGVVRESYAYAPNLPHVRRVGSFCLVELNMDQVLDVEVHESEPIPRPTREVPIFAWWFEPRVKVPPDLEAQIRAMCITAGNESGAPG